jgi:hypothetical protein
VAEQNRYNLRTPQVAPYEAGDDAFGEATEEIAALRSIVEAVTDRMPELSFSGQMAIEGRIGHLPQGHAIDFSNRVGGHLVQHKDLFGGLVTDAGPRDLQ